MREKPVYMREKPIFMSSQPGYMRIKPAVSDFILKMLLAYELSRVQIRTIKNFRISRMKMRKKPVCQCGGFQINDIPNEKKTGPQKNYT